MRKVWVLAALLASAGLGARASAATISDAAAHAGTITINANGSVTVTSPGGTYDGVEDVVYNVINNSNISVSGFTITGTGIGGLDGDGIDLYAHSDGTTILPSHYGTVQGPGVDPGDYSGFSDNGSGGYGANVYSSVSANAVTVLFNGMSGLGAGNTGFISFEAPGGVNANFNVNALPLPGTGAAGLALLGVLGAFRFWRAKLA
jgi:hypothetical protein